MFLLGILNEVIADILAKEYKPLDDVHANTIYYIAGAMLSVIHKLSKQRKNDMSQALKELKLAATTTKKDAKERLLPSSRVEAREKVNLTYAMLLKIESVYHTRC